MIQFDIILVSNAIDDGIRIVTQNCIDSIKNTEKDGHVFNVIVVEQNKKTSYKNAKTVHYDFEFNYNRCLNLGLSHSVKKYKGVCNNDLIFHENWQYGIVNALNGHVGSASPYCPKAHGNSIPADDKVLVGYQIASRLTGWAIFFTDETLSKIGRINEGVSFWFSDDIYAEQLKFHGIKHGLVCNSFVTHLGSLTLNQLNANTSKAFTVGQKKNFEKERRKIQNMRIERLYESNSYRINDRNNGEILFEEQKTGRNNRLKKKITKEQTKKKRLEETEKHNAIADSKLNNKPIKPHRIAVSVLDDGEFVELKRKK